MHGVWYSKEWARIVWTTSAKAFLVLLAPHTNEGHSGMDQLKSLSEADWDTMFTLVLGGVMESSELSAAS